MTINTDDGNKSDVAMESNYSKEETLLDLFMLNGDGDNDNVALNKRLIRATVHAGYS